MTERKYACDKQTFLKLREMYSYIITSLEALAKWGKWVRKEPQNRVGEEPRHPITIPFAIRSGIANPMCYLDKKGKEEGSIKLKMLGRKLKKPMDGLSKPFFPFADGGYKESFTIDSTALEILCIYRDARRAYGPDEEVPKIDAEEINTFHANFRRQCQDLAEEGKGFMFDGRWGDGAEKEVVAQSTVPTPTELYQ